MSRRLTNEEFIVRARKIHGDTYDYSKVEYVSAHTPVTITCSSHGDFPQSPVNHWSGSGCPTCGREQTRGKLSMTKEQFIERAREVHGDTYDYSKVEYVNTHTPVTITCESHGDFPQSPAMHQSGQGCNACGIESAKRKMSMTQEQFIERSKEVHGDTYGYSKVEYVNSHIPVTITCRTHGDFTQRPFKHLLSQGCPTCAGNLRRNTEEFIERAREVHGDTYDYSKVEYVNSHTPVTITCRTHGDFTSTPGNHLSGTGCGTCGGSERLNTEAFIERAKEVHGDTYDYSKVEYVNNNKKVLIICSEHGVFLQGPASHWAGSGCPSCASSGYDRSKIGYLYVHALENQERDILCYKLGKSNDWKFRLEKQLKPHLAKYQREQQKFEGCSYRTIEVMRFADGAIPSDIESFVKNREGKLANLRCPTIKHLDGGTEMFISNPLEELRESFPTMLESGVLVFPE
jgi:hypothetical protein